MVRFIRVGSWDLGFGEWKLEKVSVMFGFRSWISTRSSQSLTLLIVD